MPYIFPKLFEILPDADHLLSLSPEELAGPLLVSLVGNQHIVLDNVTSFDIMSRAFKTMSNEMRHKYPHEHDDDVLFALMEAWQWLEREGFVASRPTSLSNMQLAGLVNAYFVTSRWQTIETPDALVAYHKANLLPKRQLYPIISQKMWASFLRGD